MGRKNHRSKVEQAKLPAPNPVRQVVAPPPLPKKPASGVCFIAGCKRIAGVDFYRGEVCEDHAHKIWLAVEMRDATHRHVDIPGMESREYHRADARKIKAVERRKPASVGAIYFVRMDGLIKVGWTTKLADRMRAYGPKAVLLANYTATRADEAALHRQLGPCRAHGREWYSDGPIIQDFIARAIKQHGPPRFDQINWTKPKKVVAGKRSGRRWS